MTSQPRGKQPTKEKEDYYKILGVDRKATDAEIKQAYRRLALQYHPDKNSDPGATAKFQEISKAYKVLGDPKSRSTYDLFGAQAAEMMDQYEEYPGTFSRMSTCKKIVFGLLCCFTCCGFGCGCCCFCCGCCCCNFCCNRCCGLWAPPTVSNEPEEEQSYNTSQPRSHVRQQPTTTDDDSTRY